MRVIAVLAGVFVLFGVACTSTPVTTVEVTEDSKTETTTNTQEDVQLVERLNGFLENGLSKFDQGSISEGIIQIVTVLSELEKQNNPDSGLLAIGLQAEAELATIRGGLTMKSGTEWLDDNKNQISASSLDVGTDTGLNPSIILTYNFGAGETVVAGAPILFEFVKGSGLLTGFVNTNDYGQATCSIASVDSPNQENLIRASLIYRVKGYTYAFQDVITDFVYVPPSKKATIMVMEKAKDMMTEDPIILDAVYNTLKDVAFDFSQYNGRLLGDDFMKVYGGDPEAIKRLGLEKGVSYVVMVLNDGYYLNQVELNGKKYNIYKSQTTATTRIIRVVDGKIMYSGSVQGVPGQGGSEQKAVIDGFRKASEQMADKLQAELDQINQALAGTQGKG